MNFDEWWESIDDKEKNTLGLCVSKDTAMYLYYAGQQSKQEWISVEAVRKLIAEWKEEGKRLVLEKAEYDNAVGRQYFCCALELEALLPAPPEDG